MDEDGDILLSVDFKTGEVYAAQEDRMDEAAQVFLDNVRGLLMGARL